MGRILATAAYFLGIHLLSHPPAENSQNAIYFATRRFDDSCLIFPDGKSVLAALCAASGLVVIEDVDLNATLLHHHLKANDLSSLAASDATDRVKMQGTNLLCICDRKHEKSLPGKRIW